VDRIRQSLAQAERYEKEVEVAGKYDKGREGDNEEYSGEDSNGERQAIVFDEAWKGEEGEEEREDIDGLAIPTHELNVGDSFVRAIILIIVVVVIGDGILVVPLVI